MAEGWLCPGCRRAYGPHVDECKRCEPGAAGAGVGPGRVVQEKPLTPTIAELWAQWWDLVGKKRPSRKTNAAQARVLARLKVELEDGRKLTLFELPWDQLSPHVARLYRTARTAETTGRKDRDGNPAHVNDSTVNRELGTASSMLSWHRDITKRVAYNPMESFERTSEEGGIRQTSLTPEQVESFLADAHPMYQDIFRVAYRSVGMRKAEVQKLRKTEIDWDARVINLPSARNKNRRPRQIPFPDDVERILRRHAELSRGPYVFVSPRDPKRLAPVTDSAMWYWLNQARKRSGMVGFDGEPIVTHTARHSGVQALVEAGAPERFVRAAAGMSPKIFERYTKFQRSQQDILRGFQNRAVAEPTPITAELDDGRRPPASSARQAPRLVKSET